MTSMLRFSLMLILWISTLSSSVSPMVMLPSSSVSKVPMVISPICLRPLLKLLILSSPLNSTLSPFLSMSVLSLVMTLTSLLPLWMLLILPAVWVLNPKFPRILLLPLSLSLSLPLPLSLLPHLRLKYTSPQTGIRASAHTGEQAPDTTAI